MRTTPPAKLLSDTEAISSAYEQMTVDVVVMTAHLSPELVNDLAKTAGSARPENWFWPAGSSR